MSDATKRGFVDSPSTSSGAAVAECELISVNLFVNDQPQTIMVEPRMTLLDALREELAPTESTRNVSTPPWRGCQALDFDH